MRTFAPSKASSPSFAPTPKSAPRAATAAYFRDTANSFDFSKIPTRAPNAREACNTRPRGRALIESVGGTVVVSARTDATLRAMGARAATQGSRVYVRSDLMNAEDTLAHEAIHVLQQRPSSRGNASPRALEIDSSSAMEQEADRESKALRRGAALNVRERAAPNVVQLQLDSSEFASTMEPKISSLEDARKDALWVEQGIVNYVLSEKEPWTFALFYEDGSTLEIPLTKMSYAPLGGATITFFRRHQKTGRLLPFQINQLDPAMAAPSKDSAADTLLSRVPVRFDPKLTPLVISHLNVAQTLFMSIGIAKVLELQLMNPVGFGFRPLGVSTGARVTTRAAAGRAAARATAAAFDAAAVAETLVAETAAITNSGAKMLRAGSILSKMVGPSAAEKLQVMMEFFKRIGFAIGKQGVVEEVDALVIYSEDSQYAFRFIKATAQIFYGKFDVKALTYTWRILQ